MAHTWTQFSVFVRCLYARAVSNFNVFFSISPTAVLIDIDTKRIQKVKLSPFATTSVFLQFNCVRPALGSFLSILTAFNS